MHSQQNTKKKHTCAS